MAVEWKKILFAGEVDLTSSDVTGNQKDLVGGSGIKLTGGGDNVLIGADGDVDLSVDIMNTTLYDGDVDVNNDYLLIHDHSQGAGQGVTSLRRINVSDLIADIGDGVSSITFTGDATGSTNIAITSTGTVNLQGGTNQPVEVHTASGSNSVKINLDTAKITGEAGYSGNVNSDRGVASYDAANFEFSPGSSDTRIRVKADGIGATEIEDGSITNLHIADNANINDSKLGTINNAGKVDTNAVDIDGTVGLGTGSISAQDKLLLHDVSGSIGSGAHNYVATVGQIQSFIDGNIGGVANAHTGLDAPDNVDEGGLTYVSDVTFDDYGHVTAIGTDTVQTATTSLAGIVNVGQQAFSGHKTFDRITITDDNAFGGSGFGDLLVEGSATINGDLIVSGETTTLNVTTLNVQDSTIVGAVPETAYGDNQAGINEARAASSGGGFFLHSHNDANVDNYAGFKWKDGGKLTGWSAQNTADNSDAASAAFPVAVMTFTAGVPDDTVDAAGVGSFYLDTTSGSEGLYIRIT